MNIRKIRQVLVILFFCGISAIGAAADRGGGGAAVVLPQLQDLREKMESDTGIMALIMSLQDDPEIRALLSDPKIMEAVQAGDIGALLQDPRFIRVLNSPQVKEIGQRLDTRNPGGGR
jgi:hypothetical protein